MHAASTTRFGAVVASIAITLGAVWSPLAASAAPQRPKPVKTVWLCKPGLAQNPCTGDLNTLVVPAVGRSIVRPIAVAKNPPVDCFYAYPTVSQQPGLNADLSIEANEINVAYSQAGPFSQVCRVFAPMYRQVTVHGLFGLTGPQVQSSLDISYNSLLSGFRAFLAQEPKGRRFVVLGHSQGAAMLIRLVRSQIDPNPALRSRLLSALIIGGNLTVKKGSKVGGAFSHIPLCSSGHQLGCAIAYSSFSQSQPPTPDSFFGIPGQGVSLMWGQTSRSPSLEVACTSPAAFSKGFARLNPRWPDRTHAGVGYFTYPTLYRGQCTSDHGARYLEVAEEPSTSYPASVHPNDRPLVQSLGAQWGLHMDDVNIAQGDLVAFVARQEFFLRNHR